MDVRSAQSSAQAPTLPTSRPPSADGDFAKPSLASGPPQILGRPLSTRIRSEWLEDWVRDGWVRPGAEVRTHPFSLDFVELQETPAPFEGHPANALLLDGQVRFTIGHSTAEHRAADTGVRLDLSSDGAVIRTWGVPGVGDTGSGRSAQFWRALYVVFNDALRASGLLPFHASVVVRDGRATALTGPSGAGKSTTLLRAVNTRQWDVLAEDLSWLDPETLTLHGWDTGIRVWPDSIRRFAPNLAEEGWQIDARGKRFLPWDGFDATLHRTARLDTVLILSGNGAHREPVPTREALKTLWQSTGVPLLPMVRERVATTLPTLLERIRFGRHGLSQTLRPPESPT